MAASLGKTHENYSDKWFTPPEWLEWVAACLGEDYYDPCPADYLELAHGDARTYEWGRPWYCNHPGDKKGPRSWLLKAVQEWKNNRGIWCAFNVEQLRHAWPELYTVKGLKMVAPLQRIRYIWGGPTGTYGKKKRVHGEAQKSPGNWSVFLTDLPEKLIAKPPVPSMLMPLQAWQPGHQ